MQHLFGIIASVLHLGNIKYETDVRGYATLNNNQEMHWVSKVKLEPTFKTRHRSLCNFLNDTTRRFVTCLLLPISCWGFLLRCYNMA